MKSNSAKKLQCDNCPSRAAGIFCQLESAPLQEVSQQKVTNSYKKGEIIYSQGNPAFGLYCINSGKIKITKNDSQGKEAIVQLAAGGDVLGHRNLFGDETYTATAVALENTTICFLDKKFITQAISQNPSIALNIIEKLSREVGTSEKRNAMMGQKNVKERLAGLLLNLAESYGIGEDERIRLDIKLTREEMAGMVGTASETIIRFMSEFKEEGWIEQEGKTIFITKKEKLFELAD